MCRNFNVKGRACRKRKADPPSTDTKWTSDENRNDDVNYFLRNDETDNLFSDEDEILWVKAIQGTDPYRIWLPVNETRIEFEIDTGFGKTILSENFYRDNFIRVPLQSTEMTLKTYSREILKVLGTLLVQI